MIPKRNLIDTSPMPFGQHQGVPMQDVPVEYFHWLWTMGFTPRNKRESPVAQYIARSLEALKMENKDLIWESRNGK